MGQAQGLQQQGSGGRSETQKEQVGGLTETRVHAQMRGPAAEEGAGGAILDGEGLDPEKVIRRREWQRRGGVPGMHENQPPSWPRPAGVAVPVGLPPPVDQFGDERWALLGISQDQDGNPRQVQGRQLPPVDTPRPVAIPTQTEDHLLRQ
jgi:hypothetical protein